MKIFIRRRILDEQFCQAYESKNNFKSKFEIMRTLKVKDCLFIHSLDCDAHSTTSKLSEVRFLHELFLFEILYAFLVHMAL